jgi:hypothetical protein
MAFNRLTLGSATEMRCDVLHDAAHNPVVGPDVNVWAYNHWPAPSVGASETRKGIDHSFDDKHNLLAVLGRVLYYSVPTLSLIWLGVFKRRYLPPRSDLCPHGNPVGLCFRGFSLCVTIIYQDVVVCE